MRAPGRNAPLIRFLISVLYLLFVCLYRMLSHLSFFHFFLTYLLPYLLFPLRIGVLRFQAGCRKRRQILALVFLCLFCVLVHIFWLVNVCFCCVRFSFFHTKPRILAWEKVSEMTYFVSNVTKPQGEKCLVSHFVYLFPKCNVPYSL